VAADALPAPGGGPSWKIISVTDGPGKGPSGQWSQGRIITYQLGSGKSGTVWVSADDFNPDAVRAAVMREAANLDAIANLTG
jgi:hypothetical protein